MTGFFKSIHALRSIGVCFGTAGVSKTTALEKYLSENQQTVFVKANPTVRSVAGFLAVLCEKATVKKSGNQAIVFERLKEHLKGRDVMVIIDDAHEFSTENRKNQNIFELLKNMNDDGIAVLLVGNEDLEQDVWLNKFRNFFQQLVSRLEIMEVKDEFSVPDVDAVIRAVIGQPIEDTAMFDFLYRIANLQIGSLRVMTKVLKLAAVRAEGNLLTMAHLNDAAEHKIRKLKPRFERMEKKGEKIDVNLGENNKSINAENGSAHVAG